MARPSTDELAQFVQAARPGRSDAAHGGRHAAGDFVVSARLRPGREDDVFRPDPAPDEDAAGETPSDGTPSDEEVRA